MSPADVRRRGGSVEEEEQEKETAMDAPVLEEYTKEVERIFADDLVSLTVYGGHAAEEPEPGTKVSALIVVRLLRKEAMERYRAVAAGYDRKGIPVPVIATESFIRESVDVFPLEFLGMAERRRVLAGRDVMADLAVSRAHLRHQVEFELKGKLLSLRRMYLSAPGKKELAELARSSIGSVVSVARGLLLIAEGRGPQAKAEIVAAIEERFGVRLAAIRELLDARNAGKLGSARAEELFPVYLEELDGLCAVADRFHLEGN